MNRLLRVAPFLLLCLAAACTGSETLTSLTPPTAASRDYLTSSWRLTIDLRLATPRYLTPRRSADTMWVTLRDPSGVERFDKHVQLEVECFLYPGMNCNSPVYSWRQGGYKVGFIVSVVNGLVNYEGQVRAAARVEGSVNRIYSLTETYRQIGVWTMRGPYPASPTFAPGTIRQFADTAFDRWGNNVNFYYPVTYASSNTAVASVTSTGALTAVNCGTTTVSATRPDGAASPVRVSTTVMVSPCLPPPLVVSISGPLIRRTQNQVCTYTAVVSGGVPPFVWIHWYVDDTGWGDGYTASINVGGAEANPINLWVLDSAGQGRHAQIVMVDDPSAPPDPRCTY